MIILRIFPHGRMGAALPNYGKDFIITNGNNYTHAIIVNPEKNNPQLHIPIKNVVAVTCEAPKFVLTGWNVKMDLSHFLDYCSENIGKFLIGGVKDTNIPNLPPFIGHYCSLTSGKVPIPKVIYPKSRRMSIIFSEKSFKPLWLGKASGYSYRKELVYNLLEGKFPVDIYGRGCGYLRKDKYNRIKGSFQHNEPYKKYQFTIVIENMKYPHYISEKFTTPLNYKCIPVYWGCSLIEKYYPHSCIQLNGDIRHDILLIRDILKNPNKYLKDMDKALENYHVHNNLVKKCIEIWKYNK